MPPAAVHTATGRLLRDGRLWRSFRSCQITADAVLLHAIYDNLVQHAIAAGIKLQRLIGGAVLLFDSTVVSQYVERELAAFRIRFFQFQTDGADRGAFSPGKRE